MWRVIGMDPWGGCWLFRGFSSQRAAQAQVEQDNLYQSINSDETPNDPASRWRYFAVSPEEWETGWRKKTMGRQGGFMVLTAHRQKAQG